MILITKSEMDSLRKANLINENPMNKNYYITSHCKKSRRHKYYVVESKPVLNFLGIKNN